jgi:two-component system, OmpR family, response regulator
MSSTQDKPLIMTVDDEPEINTLLKEMLELQGKFRTMSAAGGNEALELLESHADDLPSLILLDIMMEPMDGWETLESIKGLSKYRRIPVVMLTAKPLTAETVNEKEKMALIENYIVKPITFTEITQKTSEILGSEMDIKNKVHALISQGKEKEAKEFERSKRAILRHRKLIDTLKKCAAATGSEDSVKVTRVVKMQENLIRMCEIKIEKIESSV